MNRWRCLYFDSYQQSDISKDAVWAFLDIVSGKEVRIRAITEKQARKRLPKFEVIK